MSEFIKPRKMNAKSIERIQKFRLLKGESIVQAGDSYKALRSFFTYDATGRKTFTCRGNIYIVRYIQENFMNLGHIFTPLDSDKFEIFSLKKVNDDS